MPSLRETTGGEESAPEEKVSSSSLGRDPLPRQAATAAAWPGCDRVAILQQQNKSSSPLHRTRTAAMLCGTKVAGRVRNPAREGTDGRPIQRVGVGRQVIIGPVWLGVASDSNSNRLLPGHDKYIPRVLQDADGIAETLTMYSMYTAVYGT